MSCSSNRSSNWALHGVDAGLAGALLFSGIALAVVPQASLSTILAGAALLSIGSLIAYAGSGTARWLSNAHNEQHATPLSASLTTLRHKRNVGRHLPCPYPDAWYVVCLSAELPAGGIVDAVVCGRSLVIFRPKSTASGLPTVLDAYCSHNGAHLGHGGSRLVGDCIRCPFHGWCFDSQGRAVSTGVGDKPPPGSDLRSWPVMERNGFVSVWMAASGHGTATPGQRVASLGHCASTSEPSPCKAEEAVAYEKSEARPAPSTISPSAGASQSPKAGDPWYEPPIFPELNGGPTAFAYHGCSEHTVPALIYEMPENGADIAHLTALHSDFVVPALRSLLKVGGASLPLH
jgi:nitrite reductase/ring-hydroxylating ferredoxin subunit